MTPHVQQVGMDVSMERVHYQQPAAVDGIASKSHVPPITPDEGLEELRRKRLVPRKTFMYEAHTAFELMFRVKSTVLSHVLLKVEFWFIVILHLILCVVYYRVSGNPVLTSSSNGTGQNWPLISALTIAIPGSMLVFFLVFHTNQAYVRFWDLYSRCVSADGRINNRLCPHMRALFEDGAFPGARESRLAVFRYLVAMYYLAYAHLPNYKKAPILDWVWQKCLTHKLLTEAEVAELKILKSGKPHKELCVWIGRRLAVHLRQGHIPVQCFVPVYEFVNDVIGLTGVLYDYAAMPVPFAFFHLLNVIVFLYLVLVAYTYTFFSYYYSIFGVFLTTLTILGLRELAIAMIDPLGTDDTDLPILDYALTIHNNVDKVIFSEPKSGSEGTPVAEPGQLDFRVDVEPAGEPQSEFRVDRD